MSSRRSRKSISDLALEAHIEEMREGEWVLMREASKGAWVDRFLTLDDHKNRTQPRLEWIKPSSEKKEAAERKDTTSYQLLRKVLDIQIGLPDNVSAESRISLASRLSPLASCHHVQQTVSSTNPPPNLSLT